MSLLSVENLTVSFKTRKGPVKANEGIYLKLEQGETLALIGETGCGKTTFGKALLRLLSKNVKFEGRIFFRGQDLLSFPEKKMRRLRGKEIGIMLQNPSLALNPVFSIGEQLSEIYRCHEGCEKKEAEKKAGKMLELVEIAPSRMAEYPHQFSGGMLQRVMVALGLALHPALLIADEPTKGLDPQTKEQIARLIFKLVSKETSALLLITHDLEVAKQLTERAAVMYAGEIVESGKTKELFSNPKHPYTQALLAALPENGLRAVPGQSPSFVSPPSGCRFHPRCAFRKKSCSQIRPKMLELETGRKVRCLLYENYENFEKTEEKANAAT
ncbi:MAG: ABC transporter ATP-binding protein [Methanosarcinaceae archaeon]|nr:ABC transporter ATP-binding protein [Methanosarcinaceae archaeon]